MPIPTLPPPVAPLPDCAHEIAQAYNVPVVALDLIRRKESSGNPNVGTVCNNRNGSCDIGVMQINTWWLPTLHKRQITASLLESNECVNVAVGAWILASNLHQYGDMRSALSAYNTGKPKSPAGLRYADVIITNMNYEVQNARQ